MSHVIYMLAAETTLSKLVQALQSGAGSELIFARNGRRASRCPTTSVVGEFCRYGCWNFLQPSCLYAESRAIRVS
ncbi:MAG TPA: hypothetical protein PLO41_10245 [Rubrivivax sp.]|nr:hypothetical protein [Rubrivivax sp.]